MIDNIICQREPDGISKAYNERRIAEHESVIGQVLPFGALKDYQTLALLDKTSLSKLFFLLEYSKSREWLTYIIKAMYRLFKFNK